MTQQLLERAVAGATGETPCTIRTRGFHAVPARRNADLEPEDLALAVDCPFCGAMAPVRCRPGRVPAVAGCDSCDVEFAIDAAEVRAVDRADLSTRAARTTHAA